MTSYGSSGGIELTDTLIEELSQEAERGYTTEQLRTRHDRKPKMDERTTGVLALVAAWMKEAGLTEIRATEEQAAEARDDDNVFTFYKDDGELVLKLTPRDEAES